MNASSCIDSIFPVVVKEFDEIYHIGSNEISEFITILQFLRVLEYNYGGRDIFSREHIIYFFLDSDNSSMKIFKLFSDI